MTTTTTITYKELKEEFVRGSSGTSPWEVLCICSTPAVGLFCYENLLKILVVNSSGTSNANTNINHHLLQRRLPIEIVAEIVSFWIPMLLSQTIWFDPYGKVYLLLQILTGSLILVWHRRRKRHRRIASSSSDCETLDCKRTSVSIYRGCLYVLTCLAILAVDFHVFPRTLMKTEEVGYSLMDLGAASFVVAAGWVSPRSRWFHLLYPKAEDDSSSLHHRHGWRLVPILGMGLIRLFAHKQVEYPEHVTEYGVHWNFFFTMSFLTVYSTIMMGSSLSSVQTPPGLLFPLSMLVIYQWLLSALVQVWVEKSPRYWDGVRRGREDDENGSIAMMKMMMIGSLYGITEWIAYHYFWHAPQTSSLAPLLRKSRSSKRLWVVSLHVLLIWRAASHFVEASRRTTNGTFVVWVLLVNMLQMAAIHSIVTKNNITHRPPMILSAVSRNGFLLFVIANLLTGAVNLSINTLEVDDWTAMLYLSLYLTVIGIIAIVLDRVKEYLPSRRKRETHELSSSR